MKKILFKGAGSAVPTPFDENGVNIEEFQKFLKFQIESKIDALIVCGTTGESSTMTKDEKIIEFTVGSDIITVNGEEQALGYAFVLRDGLPVFRIKSLCELLGYKYTLDENKIMIQSCTDYEYEMLGSRIVPCICFFI